MRIRKEYFSCLDPDVAIAVLVIGDLAAVFLSCDVWVVSQEYHQLTFFIGCHISLHSITSLCEICVRYFFP